MKTCLPVLLSAIAIAGCATMPRIGRSTRTPAHTSKALRSTIDSLIAGPQFRNALWGILIVDPASGETLYARNAAKLFMPASNMKIVTASTALAQLGAEFRYHTSVVARGAVSVGTLAGDLEVVGRGDPTVSDHMRGDAMIGVREIADSLALRGITHITGRLLAGGDAFPGPVLGFGWSWDDVDFGFSAGVDELLFNEGVSQLRVRAAATAGDRVSVETRPARTFPRIRIEATTIALTAPVTGAATPRPQSVLATRDSATGEIVVAGNLAVGDSATLEVTHRDPDAAYLAALGEALRDRGIVVDVRESAAGLTRDTLFTVLSPPLREILPALMKPSQNQIAEALLKTIGLERTGVGTADSGGKVVERQLVSWGAASDGFVVRDGSGLSRYDYLAPETLVRALDAMRRSPDFGVFYAALPVAGVDGTMRRRMRGTPAEGNLRAKTGTLANVRSLSGYVTTSDRRVLIFSLLCNNWTVPVADVDRVQDAIGAALAQLDRK